MIRLVDRVDVNGYVTGTLQVFCDGAWGAVCSSSFDGRDAQVACRQLGFNRGLDTPREPSFRATPPDSVSNIICNVNTLSAQSCMPESRDKWMYV